MTIIAIPFWMVVMVLACVLLVKILQIACALVYGLFHIGEVIEISKSPVLIVDAKSGNILDVTRSIREYREKCITCVCEKNYIVPNELYLNSELEFTCRLIDEPLKSFKVRFITQSYYENNM